MEPQVVQPRLVIVPSTITAAKEYVRVHHRHHPPPRSALFAAAVAVAETCRIVGVALVGRPVARALQDGHTAEVVRVATDGTPNAPSALYGAVRRAAKALGYRRLITYTLACEPGTSLRAAGWAETAAVKGRSWSTPSRPRQDKHPTVDKRRWEAAL